MLEHVDSLHARSVTILEVASARLDSVEERCVDEPRETREMSVGSLRCSG